MSKCTERGCRQLEWKCPDCGRTASTGRLAPTPGFGEWIDREVNFPECDRILCIGENGVHIRQLIETKWGNHYIMEEEKQNCEWTHWMPLPQAPK